MKQSQNHAPNTSQQYVWCFGIKREDDKRNILYPHHIVAPTEADARSKLGLGYVCMFAGKRLCR